MQPKTFYASDHDIDPALIDQDAISVIKKLRDAGFQAYLVGGSVRDLLVKKAPKDFDISTSARPEQIKQVFQRQCLIIGRRFRLAHVRFGRKIIEVSTFRSGENDSDLIVQDNSWGTPEEDVLRRDFTINGLLYDPESHQVIDFVGGWDDIHKNVLRTIGDPATRFRQDPVRMIRLLKFQARFGFTVDHVTSSALAKCLHEIVKSAPARILEEIMRMLESGAASPFFRLMCESGLLELLFPCLDYFFKGEFGEQAHKLLSIVDVMNIKNGKNLLDRAVLTACLIYPILDREIYATFLKNNQIPHYGQILMLSNSIIKGVLTSSFSHFPKRLSMEANFILSTQYRLTPLAGKRHHRPRLLQNKEFELALKFLKIRSMADEKLIDDYQWWLHQYRSAEKHHEKRPHITPHHLSSKADHPPMGNTHASS